MTKSQPATFAQRGAEHGILAAKQITTRVFDCDDDRELAIVYQFQVLLDALAEFATLNATPRQLETYDQSFRDAFMAQLANPTHEIEIVLKK